MNTYTVIIKNKKYETNVSKKDNDEKIIRYCKTYLSRVFKIDVNAILKLDTELKKCPFCDNYSSYLLEYKIDNMIVSFTGLKLRNSNGYDDYHCHLGRTICVGSKLNPNSVEYISKSFKISDEESLKFIHNRNKSSFYRENHITEEEYKKSQSRNLAWYISKYGELIGIKNFNTVRNNSKIKNTAAFRISEYGIESYIELLKKKTLNQSWWIEKYGDNWEDKRTEWILKSRKNSNFFSKVSINAFETLLLKLASFFTITDIRWKNNEFSLYDK